MLEDQLEGPRFENVGERVRLIRDQVAERDADARQRRFVERNQGIGDS